MALRLTCGTMLLSRAAFAQPVPEGVHSFRKGPAELCGLTGADVPALIAQLRASPRFHPADTGSDRFETWAAKDGLTQIAVTRRSEPAYPAATCRETKDGPGGNLHIERTMVCDASRETCDALFREFDALDKQVTAELSR